MPQSCTICRHPEREKIDEQLVAQTPLRQITAQTGLSSSALQRHKEHINTTLVKKKADEIVQGDDLLGQLRALQAKTLEILNGASNDPRLVLAAIREARSNTELLGRLLGELREGATINVLITPQWSDLRGRILAALSPYQEAKLALAKVLKEGEC